MKKNLSFKKNYKIIPTIFSKDKKEFIEKYNKVKDISDLFHIDIMDSKFVTSSSVNLNSLKFIKEYNKSFEVHLMVENPKDYLNNCIDLNIKKILFHIESFDNEKQIINFINLIYKNNIKSGIVINPETKIEPILPFLNKIKYKIDSIMFMSVHPGAQGQKFIENVLYKIEKLYKIDREINIQVDGGIKKEQIKKLIKKGANLFCVGSYLNEADNPKTNFKLLQEAMYERIKP